MVPVRSANITPNPKKTTDPTFGLRFNTELPKLDTNELGKKLNKGSERTRARGGNRMPSQTHCFRSEEEVLRFQKHVMRFIAKLDQTNTANNECLFLSNNRTVRRQLVTVEATSTGTLDAFNRYLNSETSMLEASVADAV